MCIPPPPQNNTPPTQHPPKTPPPNNNKPGTLDVKFVDDLVAGAWQQSTSAHDEFASSHDIFRRAVGLARTAIDPLGVLAACCGDGREVLSLDLHPMQHMAPAEQRMVAYQQTMVSAVAQMGFRINAIRPGHWLSHMLQFVPGLGPRKAAALLKGVAQHGSVFTRAELLQFFMGGVVFRNVAPYIVITSMLLVVFLCVVVVVVLEREGRTVWDMATRSMHVCTPLLDIQKPTQHPPVLPHNTPLISSHNNLPQ